MNLEWRRLRGRPRNRWLDEVREDGRLGGGKGWQESVYNREEWKKLLRTARNHHILHTPMEWMKVKGKYCVKERRRILSVYLSVSINLGPQLAMLRMFNHLKCTNSLNNTSVTYSEYNSCVLHWPYACTSCNAAVTMHVARNIWLQIKWKFYWARSTCFLQQSKWWLPPQ